MLVTSASYYKSRKSPGHELLLFTIADQADEPLNNYILLDRTPRQLPVKTPTLPSSSGPNISQLLGGPASDQFSISYRGDRDSLLRHFGGSSLAELKALAFPTGTFYLYELILLAYVTSSDRPDYHLLKSQCYWFASTMWETMRKLVPEARVESHTSTRPQLLGLNVVRNTTLAEQIIEVYRVQHGVFRSSLEKRRLTRQSITRYPTITYHSRQSSSSEADLSRGFSHAPQRTSTAGQGQYARPTRTDDAMIDSASSRPTRWWDLL
ncbi:unnamed protein product [Rhizoctonia solani]|uniref:Uncharacterized protein n=1 Tax=Rhizoctonia solani TaxID=456999 RepID=A0A8H2XWH2_9AGAM|nr:unnamed protein product [Rhizoctonia solani]